MRFARILTVTAAALALGACAAPAGGYGELYPLPMRSSFDGAPERHLGFRPPPVRSSFDSAPQSDAGYGPLPVPGPSTFPLRLPAQQPQAR